MRDLLIVIPAPLHGEGLPRNVLRPLAGRPLLLRVLDTAAQVVANRDQIVLLTDDDEVSLMAERNGCRALLSPEAGGDDDSRFASCLHKLVLEIEARRQSTFAAVMLLRPVSPLVKAVDLLQAVDQLLTGPHSSLVSACQEIRHVWKKVDGAYVPGFGRPVSPTGSEIPACRETGTFLLSRRPSVTETCFVAQNVGFAMIPQERAIDVQSRRDWWICERLLRRKRVVFVVAGHDAIGLGHTYRSTLFAHELIDHEVVFVCVRGSELAARQLRAEMFSVYMQGEENLAETVLALRPDLVINDILNTERDYVLLLRLGGAKVINFEDLGSGGDVADLVVNAIFLEGDGRSNRLNGPEYFAIRDEFLHINPSPLRENPEEVLVTFGGTDAPDMTSRVTRLILPRLRELGMRLSVVTGPGYLHLQRLRDFLEHVLGDDVELANGTKRMSDYMSRADLAFSSAGRTVFELAYMQVPAVIIASNPREESHTFASDSNGFIYLGRNEVVTDDAIVSAFDRLVESPQGRGQLRAKMAKWDFRFGKARVLAAMRSVLEGGDGDAKYQDREPASERLLGSLHYS